MSVKRKLHLFDLLRIRYGFVVQQIDNNPQQIETKGVWDFDIWKGDSRQNKQTRPNDSIYFQYYTISSFRVQSSNQSIICWLKSKQQNDNEQEQSLKSQLDAKEGEPILTSVQHTKQNNQNTALKKLLNSVRSYAARPVRTLKDWTLGDITKFGEFVWMIVIAKVSIVIKTSLVCRTTERKVMHYRSQTPRSWKNDAFECRLCHRTHAVRWCVVAKYNTLSCRGKMSTKAATAATRPSGGATSNRKSRQMSLHHRLHRAVALAALKLPGTELAVTRRNGD